MSLLVISGRGSGKKEFAVELLRSLAEGTRESLILLVGTGSGEGINREVKSIVGNRLSKDTLLVVYCSLDTKSIRYELSSISRSYGIKMAHVLFLPRDGPTLPIGAEDLPSCAEGSKLEVIVLKGSKEGLKTDLVPVFEVPRGADIWDAPLFVAGCGKEWTFDDIRRATAKIVETLGEGAKVRASTGKITPSVADPTYLINVKLIVSDVLNREVEENDTFLPLRIRREIEAKFLQSIKLSPPSLSDVPRIFQLFLRANLQ